ncbi:glycosyltransferase family 4 protein [Vibrio parahaemolyticus]|nr:glycosyltransferase family 4 protein [Vibrio parahaemolyticus]
MRILTVVCSLSKGGTERAGQTFAQAYKELGHDSKVLALSGGEREEHLSLGNIEYWLSETDFFSTISNDWVPDIIHVHSHGINKSLVYKLKNKYTNSKVVETNVFSRPTEWSDILDFSFQLSKWCQWLYDSRGGEVAKNKLISNPVNTQAFKKCSVKESTDFREKYKLNDCLVIGRIGQRYETKWSRYTIIAFEELKLRHINLKLLLVNAPDSIIKQAENSIYSNDIVIIDRIKGDYNLSIAYTVIDIFILIAEQGESFGYVSTESLLCETPIVSLNTPWADNSQAEVIGNNVGGVLVNNIKALIEEVDFLIENKSKRNKLGKSGRERIITKYNYLKIAERAIEVTLSDDINNCIYNPNNNDRLKEQMSCAGEIGIISQKLYLHHKMIKLTKYTLRYDGIVSLIKKIVGKYVCKKSV